MTIQTRTDLIDQLGELGHTTRIWTYVADAPWRDEAQPDLLGHIKNFLATWQAHGQDVRGDVFTIGRFAVVLAARSGAGHAEVTGCSIDASVDAVRRAETIVGRRLVGLQGAVGMDGDHLVHVPRSDFATLTPGHHVLRTTATTAGDLAREPFQTADAAGLTRLASSGIPSL